MTCKPILGKQMAEAASPTRASGNSDMPNIHATHADAPLHSAGPKKLGAQWPALKCQEILLPALGRDCDGVSIHLVSEVTSIGEKELNALQNS